MPRLNPVESPAGINAFVPAGSASVLDTTIPASNPGARLNHLRQPIAAEPSKFAEPLTEWRVSRNGERDRATNRFLDAFERLAILGLYVWLVARVASSVVQGGTLVNVLLLVSEGLVVVFLLARRPSRDLSRAPKDWLLAIVATCGPLLVRPSGGDPIVPPAAAAALWLAGTFVQLWAKVALGRSFGCVPAHRGLQLEGPYHFVRHPMYAGYLLGHVAFWLLNPTIANLVLLAMCDALQVPRLLAEEQLLGRDPSYRRYRSEVRYRLIPRLF